MPVGLAQALGWRLDRQYLSIGSASAAGVAHRLGAIPLNSGDRDLAVRRRLVDPRPDAVSCALSSGELVGAYAFRGAAHLMTPEDDVVYMAVRGASRQWEKPSWQAHYGLDVGQWTMLRQTVRDAVAGGPLTRTELVDSITAMPRLQHLRVSLLDPSHTLLKPLAWQGDLCFGAPREGQLTFQSPSANPRWQGLPGVDDAGRRAVCLYLAGYGPATRANLDHWLVAGLSAGRRRLDRWLAQLLGHGVVEIRVDGVPSLVLDEHHDALIAQQRQRAEITLLPGLDQWVLGPGTADERIIPKDRRRHVTRGANLVLHDGVVAGSWQVGRDSLKVWTINRRLTLPRGKLEREVDRLSQLYGRELKLAVNSSNHES